MVLQLGKLIEVCKATVLCSDQMNLDSDFLSFEINSLLFDSRRLNSANHTVFFAIRTANNDGHRYINELYDKGVRIFVCTIRPEKLQNGAYYLLVEDSLKALQRLATYARNSFSGNVIAIGGSNGKTIVKEWSRVLIAQDKKVCISPRSYNSQIGVAVSLWQLNENFEAGIFEAGISEPNEMQSLHDMILPDTGLITNIGEAHGANFSSIEEKLNEKLKLFEGCKRLICSQDNPILFEKVSEFCKSNNIELISYDTESMARKLQLPFEDRVSKENAASACVPRTHSRE